MSKHLSPNLDSVTTIRDDGSRRILYPADVRGRFTLARRISAAVLIAVYILLPWVKVGGYPAVFLDIATRRFHLFGFTLAAQDVWLMFFLITGLGFLLFFLTALLGRVWCGWACPQTVFLEHIFRGIERMIDGDAVRRRSLAGSPWTAPRVLRAAAKHALYVVAAAGVAHLFLAYFVSIPHVWAMMRAAPGEHWSTFVFMAVATGILYFNFSWFREQLCIVICPYGRLQSALVDENTLVIGYDAGRGEPRMTVTDAHKKPGAASGDCVACNRCVQVCPTGIDIRNGLQLECVGCAACIDACDEVMVRLHRPKGLVRYDSPNGLAGKATRWIRPRLGVYAFLLAVGIGVASWGLSTLHPAVLGVTRMIGAPYIVDAQFVRNQFLVRLVNKTTEPAHYTLSLRGGPDGLVRSGLTGQVEVPALGEVVEPLIIQQPRGSYSGPFTFRTVVQDSAGTFQLERQAEFLGPDPQLLREDESERAGGGHG